MTSNYPYAISSNEAITSNELLALVVIFNSSAACRTTFCSPPIGTKVEPVRIGALDMIE
jgi:hypothetical protein